MTASRYGVSFCGDDSVIKLIEVMFAQLCKNTKKVLNCVFYRITWRAFKIY